ncbi:hypothetical protein F4861DRAFT_551216 [Xylaria intraflava]|nr:hypothetical protein F4861DRAFT_551216 [Xylaria intraflava]
MSYARAFQSLAFYLLSCSPCHREIQRRRVKRAAKRQQEQKEKERECYDGIIYQQPAALVGPHTDRKNRKKSTRAINGNSLRHLADVGADIPGVIEGSIAGTVINNLTPNIDLGSNTPITSNTSTTGTAVENIKPSDASISCSNSSRNYFISSRELAKSAFGISQSPKSTTSSTGPGGPNNPMLIRAALGLTGSPSLNIENGSWETVIWPGSESTVSLTSSETCEYLHQEQWEKVIQEEPEYQIETDHAREELMKALSYLGTIANDVRFARKHPSAGDLRPPIVRMPADKAAAQWMVAPPPPAEVMDRICRDRSGSLPSQRSTPSKTSRHTAHCQTGFLALQRLAQGAPSGGCDGLVPLKGGSVASGHGTLPLPSRDRGLGPRDGSPQRSQTLQTIWQLKYFPPVHD